MPLIKKPHKAKKKQIRIRIDEKINATLEAYLNWINNDFKNDNNDNYKVTIDDFIEQAVLLVFEKDKEWKSYKKE